MRNPLLILLVFLASCTEIIGPDLLADAVAYSSPALAQLWSGTEQCSGLRGDFASVRFYTVPQLMWGGRWATGAWYPPNRIVLAEPWKNDSRTIKHEIMHDLLQGAGHPLKYFGGVCGDLGS